ncbi:T9SS type A sorting domain-containing protein [Algibacter sp. R77976]
MVDLVGRLRISKILSNAETINVESLSKGMYILSIKDDLGNTTYF